MSEPAPAPAAPTRRRPDAGTSLAVVSVGGLVLAAAVMGRHLWYFSDDWNIITRYHSGGLLEPFNGHLSLVPAGIYQLIFHTVGLGHYWVFRLMGLGALSCLGVLAFVYARARVGSVGAALATTAIVWGSGGVTVVMFPFLANFSLPIAMLLAVWILMDRHTPRADVAASLCLAVGLATSGLGVLAMGAVGVELAVSRAHIRRWITFAPPVVLWLAWYVTHQIAAPGDHRLRSVVSYAVRMMWGGSTALAAGWKPGGVIVGLFFLAIVAVAAWYWHSLDARSIGALVAPFLFAGLTAFTRLHVVPAIPPDENRYRWTIAAGLVLAVVCMWRSSPRPTALPRWAMPALGVVALAVVGIGGGELMRDIRTWDDTVTTGAPGLRAEVFAAEAVGSRVDQRHVLPLSYVPVTLGAYRKAIADIGSPLGGWSAADFGGTIDHRLSADTLLAMGTRTSGFTAPSGAGCTNYQSGTPIEPGQVIALVDEVRLSYRLGRFSPHGVPIHLAPPDPKSPGAFLEIPRDAQGTPEGAPPYRLFSSRFVHLLRCPSTR
jgi:hypothetical protein